LLDGISFCICSASYIPTIATHSVAWSVCHIRWILLVTYTCGVQWYIVTFRSLPPRGGDIRAVKLPAKIRSYLANEWKRRAFAWTVDNDYFLTRTFWTRFIRPWETEPSVTGV